MAYLYKRRQLLNISRMEGARENQFNFSSLLFDTLIGLVLFFGLEEFVHINNLVHLLLYFFITLIAVHWWLVFKSVDDCYDEEADNSATYILFGIFEVFIINYMFGSGKSYDYTFVTLFTIVLLLTNLGWAALWRYVGRWKTADTKRIAYMEAELDQTIKSDIYALVLFSTLLLFVPTLPAGFVVVLFVMYYCFYIFLTFKHKIVDIKLF